MTALLGTHPVLAGSVLLFGALVALLAVAVFHARERRRWIAVAMLLLACLAGAVMLSVTALPSMLAAHRPTTFAPHAPIVPCAPTVPREPIAPYEPLAPHETIASAFSEGPADPETETASAYTFGWTPASQPSARSSSAVSAHSSRDAQPEDDPDEADVAEYTVNITTLSTLPEELGSAWAVPPSRQRLDIHQEVRRAIKSLHDVIDEVRENGVARAALRAAGASSSDEGPSRAVTVESDRSDRSKRDRSRGSSVRARAGRSSQTAPEPPLLPEPARKVFGHAAQYFCFSLLLVLAYLFVDAGRRRRYTWLRRFAIAGAFIVVCALIWRSNPLFLV